MPAPEPVAIVGMSVILPGAPDLQTYWQNLVTAKDCITEVPDYRRDSDPDGQSFFPPPSTPGLPTTTPPQMDQTYCQRGGFVGDVVVDVASFGVMPSSVEGIEADQLITLKVAAAAVADAGGLESLGDRDRVAVILGRGGYLAPNLQRFDQRVRGIRQTTRLLRDVLPSISEEELERVRTALLDSLPPMSAESTIGLVPNLTASRVANRLDLHGPAYTIDAACASSLIAVEHAVDELATRRCDAVLVGGVHHCNDDTLWATFTQLGALSHTQMSRPLSAEADGLLIGEGTGVVVLKRLADAQRDGNRIYAVIRSVATSSDGRATSLFNPAPQGQELAIRRAWDKAGLDPQQPGSIGMIEAHATATRVGDVTELGTLAKVFGGPDGSDAVIGSVKSMIGHTMPASGIAGLVKVALALHNKTLLPTLHCENPHPAMSQTRFHPLAQAQPWPQPADGEVRRGGVNSFGFGGINAHVIVEEPPATATSAALTVASPSTPSEDDEVILRFAAQTPEQMLALLERSDEEILANPVIGEGPIRLGAGGLNAKRLTVVRNVVKKCLNEGISWRGRNDIWFTAAPLLSGDHPARIAFVSPGLEGDFAPQCEDVATHFGLPMPALSTVDIRSSATSVTKIGLLLHDALAAIGVRPDGYAGHSVGEWTAMILADMYAVTREQLFNEYWPLRFDLPDVDFVVLGCPSAQALDLIADLPNVVISHDNAPRQTIVCGVATDAQQVVETARAAGVVAKILPFKSGFHTPMIAPYLDFFTQVAHELPLQQGNAEVWSATTVQPYPSDEASIRQLYIDHLIKPVLFRQVIERMYASGYQVFIQLGAGQLSTYISDTLTNSDHLVINANSTARSGMAQLRRVATALWVEGATPNFAALGGADAAPARTETAPLAVAATAPKPGRGMPIRTSTPLFSLAHSSAAGMLEHHLSAPVAATAPVAAQQILDEAVPLPEGLPGSVAAEFAALLNETREAARAVATAAAAAAHAPAQPVVTVAPIDTPPAPPAVVDSGSDQRTLEIVVSLETMPYLRDHQFYRQPPGWSDDADFRPVLAATSMVDLAVRLTEQTWPDWVVVAAHDATFSRWLLAAPATTVQVSLQREGDLVTVALGDYSAMTLELAATYPPAPLAQQRLETERERWSLDEPEEPPHFSAPELYSLRNMFHGPQYQGLTKFHGVGRWHMRGEVTTPSAPGSLLDNVGQLLGAWLHMQNDDGLLAFPRSIKRIDLYAPHPPIGAALECYVKLRTPEESTIEMDGLLINADGTVWSEITDWKDHRFECDRNGHQMYAWPERNAMSQRQPGGWSMVEDGWPGVATRDIYAGIYLNSPERETFNNVSPRGRRHWLLGRMAVKDAVRAYLADIGIPEVFPSEVLVSNAASGQPMVRGHGGRVLPDISVSLAHSGTIGVAIARGAGDRPPGIDVQQVVDVPAAEQIALSEQERALLEHLCNDGQMGRSDDDLMGTDGSPMGRPEWFIRIWAAKEAVAKSLGTGLGGRPKDFAVTDISPTAATVVTAGPHAEHTVHFAVTHDRGHDYVIAWT